MRSAPGGRREAGGGITQERPPAATPPAGPRAVLPLSARGWGEEAGGLRDVRRAVRRSMASSARAAERRSVGAMSPPLFSLPEARLRFTVSPGGGLRLLSLAAARSRTERAGDGVRAPVWGSASPSACAAAPGRVGPPLPGPGPAGPAGTPAEEGPGLSFNGRSAQPR